MRVDLHWPKIDAGPASEYKTSCILRMSSPLLFPGGTGCFFDDRPFGDGFTSAEWIGRSLRYYDGRFSAYIAFPFGALNMMYRRRSVEQIGLFLKSHVEGAPENAAELQAELREGDVSFTDRPRRFVGGTGTSRNRRLLARQVRRR